MVHLLAFERLAGVDHSTVDYAPVDWLARSEKFSQVDNDPGVAELAAELLTAPSPVLDVTFASGGQLVRGAAAAAASIYAGKPARRIDGNDKVVDRSVEALRGAGLTVQEARTLIHAWAIRDEQAAVVLVDLDAPGASDAEHELRCRYGVVHSEVDYLTLADSRALGASRSGSIRVFCVKVGPTSLPSVVVRHCAAVLMHREGVDAAHALTILWRRNRTVSSSRSHDRRLRRLRRLRRQMLANQLRDRAFGR
ncbi:MAG: hypothetical protein ACI81L_000680 [Verrucomicrobiales bacterium]